MLLATLGVVAALAFVLGLGALCLWALKRWGRMSLTSRTRIAVEVVQRIPLGPKTGLAVVRVGEKVMAVSVGDGAPGDHVVRVEVRGPDGALRAGYSRNALAVRGRYDGVVPLALNDAEGVWTLTVREVAGKVSRTVRFDVTN